MNKREWSKFIYWIIMPISIGTLMFYYIDRLEISLLDKLTLYIMIAIPISFIRTWIGVRIFKEKQTLAEKIMLCKLRRKYGKDYCAKCPDGYTCCTL